MMLIQYSVNSDWLFNTQSRVLQAGLFILEINEKATLNINMSYPLRYQYWWLFMVLNWYQRHKNLILHQNWVDTWYRVARSVIMWNRPLGTQIRIYHQVWYWLNPKIMIFWFLWPTEYLLFLRNVKWKKKTRTDFIFLSYVSNENNTYKHDDIWLT